MTAEGLLPIRPAEHLLREVTKREASSSSQPIIMENSLLRTTEGKTEASKDFETEPGSCQQQNQGIRLQNTRLPADLC